MVREGRSVLALGAGREVGGAQRQERPKQVARAHLCPRRSRRRIGVAGADRRHDRIGMPASGRRARVRKCVQCTQDGKSPASDRHDDAIWTAKEAKIPERWGIAVACLTAVRARHHAVAASQIKPRPERGGRSVIGESWTERSANSSHQSKFTVSGLFGKSAILTTGGNPTPLTIVKSRLPGEGHRPRTVTAHRDPRQCRKRHIHLVTPSGYTSPSSVAGRSLGS